MSALNGSDHIQSTEPVLFVVIDLLETVGFGSPSAAAIAFAKSSAQPGGCGIDLVASTSY